MRCEGVYCVQQGAASADLLGSGLQGIFVVLQLVKLRRGGTRNMLRECWRFPGVSALIEPSTPGAA